MCAKLQYSNNDNTCNNEIFVYLIQAHNIFGRQWISRFFATKIRSPEGLITLIECIDCVDVKDKFGLTPLHYLCQMTSNTLPILNLLMSMKVNVNCQDDYGSTPLHHCVHFQNHVAMECLLNAGASLDIRDRGGKTVIDRAILEGGHAILQLLNLSFPVPLGVSDERINCLLPLCCDLWVHPGVKYIDQSTIEINVDDVDGWLSKYSVCQHNADFILHKAIPLLRTDQERTRLEAEEASSLFTDVLTVLERTARRMEKLNPLFRSDVIAGGSVAEFTKIGSLDEMDFLFCLTLISDKVEIEEPVSEVERGYVRLNPNLNSSGLKEFVNKDGYVSRCALSEKFHNLFEEAFFDKSTFENSRIYALEGTLNSDMFRFNIGQLRATWYGMNWKGQDICVDIVPALQKKGWRSKYLLEDMRVVDQSVLDNSCLLIMEMPYFDSPVEDDRQREKIKELFTISFARTEHSILRALPPVIRDGYRIAKSVLKLCPRLKKIGDSARCLDYLIQLNPGPSDRDRKSTMIENGQFCFLPNVQQTFASYDLKTALLHMLHDKEIKIEIPNDFDVKSWNESTHCLARVNAYNPNVLESLMWAKHIFHKLKYFILYQKNKNQSYFFPFKARPCQNDKERISFDIKNKYCKIALRLLDGIEIRANKDE